MLYTKDTKWFDNCTKEIITNEEFVNDYIDNDETWCGERVIDLFNRVVMSDCISKVNDVRNFEMWLKNTPVTPIKED